MLNVATSRAMPANAVRNVVSMSRNSWLDRKSVVSSDLGGGPGALGHDDREGVVDAERRHQQGDARERCEERGQHVEEQLVRSEERRVFRSGGRSGCAGPR